MDRASITCSVCQASYPYDYFGRRPPFAPSFTFLEDSFLLKDPFSDAIANAVVCVGSRCGACWTTVCASPGCSIFYSVRMCAVCVNDEPHRLCEKLPSELGAQVKALKRADEMPVAPKDTESA
jgi:hypothetical protein